ncbi:MAG: PorP/SprF family type IX secretion system membrane protein, partial [Bacteroidota bacterium]
MRDEIQLLFTYRTQPNAEGDNFTHGILSGIYPFLNRNNGNRWGGLGLSIMHDRRGEFLHTTAGLLALAYNVKVKTTETSQNYLSLGLQGGFFQRRLSLTGLTTSSQYLNGSFDPNLGINEFNENDRQNYGIFSAGGIWYSVDTLNALRGFLGLSIFNINSPESAFYDNVNDDLPLHFTVTGGYRVLNKEKYSIVPNFRWVNRTGNNQVNAGAWLNYKVFRPEQTGFLRDGTASLGLWYNFNNAFVGALQWDQPRYFLTLSFDLPTRNTTSVWQGNNAFEITVGLRIPRKQRRLRIPVGPVFPQPYQMAEKKPQSTLVFQRVPVPKSYDPVPPPETKPGLEDGAFRFKFNSNELDDRSKEILDSVSTVLNKYPDAVIDISGHTCDIGRAEANLELSRRRTAAVKKYLVDKYKIEPKRIQTSAFGESRPLVPNLSEANRRINRRVAFKMRFPDE